MDLAVRYTLIFLATIAITIFAPIIFVTRDYFRAIFRYNRSFLALFGVESAHVSWVQYLVSWLLGTCMATVFLTLLVNMAETLLLVSGMSGIPLNPTIILLALGGIIATILLLIVEFIPMVAMPFACPSAFGIITLLHLYSIPRPYPLIFFLSYASNFLYFAALAIGFVGTFLSLYLLFRDYIGLRLLQRLRGGPDIKESTQSDENSLKG
ncbi:MAG: hypothetical protein ACFFD8_06280 [Candidatus Thorarchaeota archaeon]